MQATNFTGTIQPSWLLSRLATGIKKADAGHMADVRTPDRARGEAWFTVKVSGTIICHSPFTFNFIRRAL